MSVSFIKSLCKRDELITQWAAEAIDTLNNWTLASFEEISDQDCNSDSDLVAIKWVCSVRIRGGKLQRALIIVIMTVFVTKGFAIKLSCLLQGTLKSGCLVDQNMGYWSTFLHKTYVVATY